MTTTITTLDELLTALRAIRYDPETGDPITATIHPALPTRGGLIEWSNFPTFGGDEPSDTMGIWSWDALRVLVSDGRDFRLALRARDEW